MVDLLSAVSHTSLLDQYICISVALVPRYCTNTRLSDRDRNFVYWFGRPCLTNTLAHTRNPRTTALRRPANASRACNRSLLLTPGVGGSGLFEGRAVACSKAMRRFPRRPGSGLLEGRGGVCLKSGPRFARRPGTGLLEGLAGTAEKERYSGARGNTFITDTTAVASG